MLPIWNEGQGRTAGGRPLWLHSQRNRDHAWKENLTWSLKRRKGKEKGSKEGGVMRKRLCVLSPWSLKSNLDLQGAAQYLYSPGNAPKQGTVSHCIDTLIWSSPKLKVWWRVSAAWTGNTLWLGELGSSAGRRDVGGWKSNIHRGRKWDFDTEKCFPKSKIQSAYD